MTKQFAQIIKDVDDYAIKLRELIPEALGGFGTLSRAAQGRGTLDRKMKELIALAIAVSGRCDACIAYHARGALRAGVSRQELGEALAVAIQMGGGPAVNSAADALRAFDEFEVHNIAGEAGRVRALEPV